MDYRSMVESCQQKNLIFEQKHGAAIASYRRSLGLSQDKFAKLLGYTKGMLSGIERGRVKISCKFIELLKAKYPDFKISELKGDADIQRREVLNPEEDRKKMRSIEELANMAKAVLRKKDSRFSNALEANIIAFFHGISLEDDATDKEKQPSPHVAGAEDSG